MGDLSKAYEYLYLPAQRGKRVVAPTHARLAECFGIPSTVPMPAVNFHGHVEVTGAV